jgi:hypothetical protein
MAMGFLAMRQMAERMQEWDIVGKAGAQTLRFKNQIEEIFWVDEFGSYAGMVDEKLKPQISDFEKEKGEFNHMPSVYLAHSRAGEKSRMVSALKRVDRPMSSNELGVFLGISNPDEGGFMPYSTNMAAVGAFNYGEQEQGLRFLRGTAKCLGHIMPGALPETVASDGDPNKFNLYESSHWEFLQLWSAALYCEGLVWGLLRVEPDAAWGKVKMTPKLPEGWPYAEIKNLRIGQTRLSVRIDKGNKATVTHIDGPELEVIIQDANDETVYASTFEG